MSNKIKIIIASLGVAVSITLLAVSAVLTENNIISAVFATVFTGVSIILTFVAVSFAAKVEYESSVYECRKCGHVFKPTFKAYICGAHSLTTRQLKCPKCYEKSWCKRKSV